MATLKPSNIAFIMFNTAGSVMSGPPAGPAGMVSPAAG